jgi:hypothetical protein
MTPPPFIQRFNNSTVCRWRSSNQLLMHPKMCSADALRYSKSKMVCSVASIDN